MRIYKLACIGAFIILLSGCNAFSAPTEEPSLKETPDEVKEVVKKELVILDVETYMEKYEDQMGGYQSYLIIDEEVASYKGSSETYFSYPKEVPFKISLTNSGAESFLFRVYNVDEPNIAITNGVLKRNEIYEKVFHGLPEGAYVISYLIEEEKTPDDIQLQVKVELLPWGN
ncbi:hypothetical protein ACIQ2D_04475 [Lysinibacillus sp. NPDC097287]|uniref:hypothetical protein n=1 Tax=Lysinibacillus sp. NPDC097287 TaxID=3364144 RepID=UPI0037F71EB3